MKPINSYFVNFKGPVSGKTGIVKVYAYDKEDVEFIFNEVYPGLIFISIQ